MAEDDTASGPPDVTGDPAIVAEALGEPDLTTPLAKQDPATRKRTVRKIVSRVVIIVVVLGLSGWLMFRIFDDLDFEEIRAAIAELSDAEWLSLTFGWLVWIVAQGALTASLVDKLAVRRGVLASLGPTAVSSMIPGPSDLPVRYSMYQSWGVSATAAATAVAASGIFSLGSQLILPSIAGVLIVIADVPLEGFFSVIVTASVILAVLVAITAFLLGSEKRTEGAGRRLDGAWRAILRRLKKPEPEENLGTIVADQRRQAFDHLSDKWLKTTAATIAALLTKFALLLMALRFVGIPESELGWMAVFAVFGLVAGLTAIPLTPGSAGIAEIGFVGMLTAAAGTEWVNQITAGVLLYRLLTWLLIIPVGIGALGVWRYGIQKAEQRANAAA
ncbi:MAG: lysylphosphatidylglycerol synthase domain-containing protein [Ilumatobacteraceae bacterium]